MNRTRKYLVPVLKTYGKEFEEMYTSIFKLAIGIGDHLIKDIPEKSLFLLVNSTVFPTSFLNFQKWIVNQPMYLGDYAFDNINTGYLHMFIIKYPEEYSNSYDFFKKSEYSKMFTQADLEKFFTSENVVTKIANKDHTHKAKFAQQVSTAFETVIKEEDITDTWELDLPIELDDEIFNFKK